MMTCCRIKRNCRSVLTISLLILLVSSFAFSWGPMGHRVIAKMAEERLTPAALAAIHDLLGSETSLVDIAGWADEQKEDAESSPWHFVNVPITESRYDNKYCQPEGCVVSKIKDFRNILEDPKSSKAEKRIALKFLVHLIADLHQPLHVGDTGSRGGNEIWVRYYGQDTDLHHVWDTLIMKHYSKYEGVWLWEMTGKATLEKTLEWSRGTPEDWATESLQAARKAYSLPGQETVMKSGSKLGDEYTSRAIPIIEEQLAKAGIRTAWMLNQIFK